MEPLVIQSPVDADGVLRLAVPLGSAKAGIAVQVTIEAAKLETARADYDAWVDAITGAWQGPFERISVGDYESREAL